MAADVIGLATNKPIEADVISFGKIYYWLGTALGRPIFISAIGREGYTEPIRSPLLRNAQG
jgi:hypothetical protein